MRSSPPPPCGPLSSSEVCGGASTPVCAGSSRVWVVGAVGVRRRTASMPQVNSSFFCGAGRGRQGRGSAGRRGKARQGDRPCGAEGCNRAATQPPKSCRSCAPAPVPVQCQHPPAAPSPPAPHLERAGQQAGHIHKGHVFRCLHHLQHPHAAGAARRDEERQEQRGLHLALLRLGLAQVRPLGILLHVAAHLGLRAGEGRGREGAQGSERRQRQGAGTHANPNRTDIAPAPSLAPPRQSSS